MKKSTLIYKGLLASASVISILGSTLGAKAATLVDIELALVVDGSGSISQAVFDEHIAAIDSIFNHANFYEDFVKPLGKNPSLAVGFYHFGTVENNLGIHEVTIEKLTDWTVYNQENKSGINLNNVQKIGGFTPIGNVIDQITEELLNNDYESYKYQTEKRNFTGTNTVINLSSDGFNNLSTINPLKAAQKAFKEGVTINALALPSDVTFTQEVSGKEEQRYDEDFLWSVVDPYPTYKKLKNPDEQTDAFVIFDYAKGEQSLVDVLRLKVTKETTGVLPVSPPVNSEPENIPEPTSLFSLLAMGVWGLCKQYKKK